MKKIGLTLPTTYVDVTNEEMEYMEGAWSLKSMISSGVDWVKGAFDSHPVIAWSVVGAIAVAAIATGVFLGVRPTTPKNSFVATLLSVEPVDFDDPLIGKMYSGSRW